MAAESLADIEAELAAVRAFMRTNPGVLEMQYGDKRYKFESLGEIRAHVAWLERRVVIASGANGSIRYAATSKGV